MFQHRPTTNFKQANKTHKTGKHDAKGTLTKKLRGKVDENFRPTVKSMTKNAQRQDRKHQGRQKRDVVLQKKRSQVESVPTDPKIVAVISLNASVESKSIWEVLVKSCDEIKTEAKPMYPFAKTVTLPQWRQRAVFFSSPSDLNGIMDLTKVADLVLFIMSPDGIDAAGNKLTSVLKGQGLPSIIGIIHGLNEIPQKRRHDLKKQLTKDFHLKFPDEPKVLTDDGPQDIQQIIRFIANTRLKPVTWRERRPYMLVDSIQVQDNPNNNETVTLLASGYLRGRSLNVNHLVHIPDWGDFQLKQVDTQNDPYSERHAKKESGASMDIESNSGSTKATVTTLAVADPQIQESLVSENDPDPLEGEQTWPTEEELADAEERDTKIKGKQTKKKKVPKGFSSYQAAWILDSESEGEAEEGEEEADQHMSDDEYKVEGNTEANDDEMEPKEKDEEENSEEEYEEIDDNESVSGKDAKLLREIEMEEENRKSKNAEEEELDDLEFPDEVETPRSQLARIRFQKFRGLKSFRSSPWDPKESLPRDYAKIFQFQNFRKTKQRVFMEDPLGIQTGIYATLHIMNVPKKLIGENWNTNNPLVIGGLLKYENKISVVHFSILKHPSYTQPVKSKDSMVFHCGFRRYPAVPVFSQANFNCDKHKYERFLHPGRATIASVYAPITFPSVPMVALSPSGDLLATGSLMNVDPDRIILKKIILTGRPFKLHKKTVVIREMFYDAGDVNWFKPVELWTKFGRTGNIQESLGTHGYMKCVFDGIVGHNDTVCMNLYKRIFPRWTRDQSSEFPTLSLSDPKASLSPTKIVEPSKKNHDAME